ncbi:proton-conducting transporter transmembrane domain-containing protein [Rhodopila globiformis]|uniref:NADH:quinone oxidoreductase/Mrp antiporter transmembrane domain-containing protein n=1 Tax=Rhodopila globiformis TaxID=1071 RepID=A0A2S6ND11_RHOGL|nr:proton-conducting transporter membrane subunit [Rhodopila globiformis]PPQ32484.1 hypothetical protein CCS01_15680 [Rhodopila globiformis]
MSDLILLLLTADMAALLLLGALAAVVPPAAGPVLTAGLGGLGALLCVPLVLPGAAGATLDVSAGPPGLHLHLALGPLPAFFLLLALFSGTAIALFQKAAAPRRDLVRATSLCLAGAILSLLAADGVTLLLGATLVCAMLVRDRQSARARATLLVPLLLLAAVCLLTPTGFPPRFDAIRAAPVGDVPAGAAAALTVAGVSLMLCPRVPGRDWVRQALVAGAVLPVGLYLLIRLVADLSAPAVQTGWGVVLLAAGGWITLRGAWRAASEADITAAVAALVRRQAGLMVIGVGLALTARATDLPQAQSLALEATMLLALGTSLAGTAAVLAVEAMASSTGTVHPARLGGLAQTMPRTAAVLAACLLGVAALPPGVGFAALWLLFQALLAGPRTGGLIDQVPPALAATVIALSAAIATAAAVRLVGVAVLGRPRTPQGAGAREILGIGQIILATMAALSLVAGIIPAVTLRYLADAAVREVSGSTQGVRSDMMMLAASPASPGYAALPVLALLVLATGCAILVVRWLRREAKPAGLWFDGMTPPAGFPFGEPMAQSAGTGFLPSLPALPALPRLRLPPRPRLAAVTPVAALWLLLAAFGALLLILAIMGGGA